MSTPSPNSIAASIKIIAEAIKTTFGATVVINTFVGTAFVLIASGWANFESPQRERILYVLLGFLGASLLILFFLRVWNPTGLGGPPIPSTENTKFLDSSAGMSGHTQNHEKQEDTVSPHN